VAALVRDLSHVKASELRRELAPIGAMLLEALKWTRMPVSIAAVLFLRDFALARQVVARSRNDFRACGVWHEVAKGLQAICYDIEGRSEFGDLVYPIGGEV